MRAELRSPAAVLLGLLACSDGTGPAAEVTFHDRIVFVSDRGPLVTSLYQMGRDGSDVKPVPQDAFVRPLHPAVSPDGRWVAFDDASATIRIQRADGTDPRNVSEDAGLCGRPAWDPSGNRLAFTCRPSVTEDSDIHIADLDAGTVGLLLLLPGSESKPEWSPDGTRLLFTGDRDGNPELYLLELGSSTTTRLTETENRQESFATWSPNGRWIAYHANPFGGSPDGEPWLERLDVESGTVDSLYSLPGQTLMPAWSPDSRKLVFARGVHENGTQELVELDVATGEITVLLGPSGFDDRWPSYGPAGGWPRH